MTLSFRFPGRAQGRRLARLRAFLPVLTAAEKTALIALTLVLACGGALRLWERSGVRIGPVDDWEGLRALVTRSQELLKAEGGAVAYPCLDDAPRSYPRSSPRGTGGGRGAASGALTLAAAGADAKTTRRAAAAGGKKAPARAVDLNTAGERALLTLPGVGPSTARAILAHRAAHGPFRAVDDLLQVKGIGSKKLEALRPYARVEGAVAKPEIAEEGERPAP